MSKIVVDDVLRAKLNGLNTDVELCDESGQTLGHFVPAEAYMKWTYAWLRTQVTDDELAQLQQQTGGSPLADIWQRLGRT